MLKQWAAIVLLSFLAATAAAQDSWQINLKEADIGAFINQVADITGKSFVIDPRVKGKVNVLSSEPMNKEAVYELFLSVLQVQGFSAVPAGDVTLIVQQNDMKQLGQDLSTNFNGDSQEVLTKVIMIKNVPALDLVPILRPLVAKYGHLAGVKSANALIVTDLVNNINRLEQIIERLDKSGSEELEVIQLKEAWVGNVVTMLQNLDPSKVAQGTSNAADNTAGSVRVVADERSNRIIIKGEKNARERIRNLINELDKPSYFSGSAQVIRLQYADATKLAELIKGVMDDATNEKDKEAKGKVAIHADEDLNALVVRAEPSLMREVQSLVASLDVRRAQVLIESAIVEVTGDINDALGFQWAAGAPDKPVAGTNFGEAGPSASEIASGILTGDYTNILGSGITLGGYAEHNGKPRFAMVMQALASNTKANMLSTPSIMTLDNQEAEIIVGQNVPFRTGSTSSSNNDNPFTTITREDVGITLKVKPHIHEGEAIRLEVEATAESVSQTTITGSADLITNKRSLKTMILAEDGATIVLGGLIRDDVREVVSKVPLLGDIPLIGWLFKSKSEQQQKSNLMVFLRPTVLSNEITGKRLAQEKYNGIWEFTLSGKTGKKKGEEAEDGQGKDYEMTDLFKGLPVNRK